MLLCTETKYLRDSSIYVGTVPSNVGSHSVCATIGPDFYIPPGGNKTFYCNPWLIGQYVTIRKNVELQPITICEVVVSGNNFNPTPTGK